MYSAINNCEIFCNADVYQLVRDMIAKHDIKLSNINKHKFLAYKPETVHDLNKFAASVINPSLTDYRNVLVYFRDDHGVIKQIRMPYRVHDPVIMRHGVEGYIYGFGEQVMKVKTGDDIINVEMSVTDEKDVFRIHDVELAYAVSITRAQGCQWENVYYYVDCETNERVLYTAITRGVKKCFILQNDQLI